MKKNKDNNAPHPKSLVIIGAGGHAVSVANVALSCGYEIKFFVDKNKNGTNFLGYKVIGDLTTIAKMNDHSFAVAVGDNFIRERVVSELVYANINLSFPSLVHSSAIISSFTNIGEGTVVMPNAVIGPNCMIGNFCIINTKSSIDHDCVLQDFSSLAPGALLGGGVQIGLRSVISMGAIVKHGQKVGFDSVVGACSYLNRDLPNNQLAYGVPAKKIRAHNAGDKYLN